VGEVAGAGEVRGARGSGGSGGRRGGEGSEGKWRGKAFIILLSVGSQGFSPHRVQSQRKIPPRSQGFSPHRV